MFLLPSTLFVSFSYKHLPSWVWACIQCNHANWRYQTRYHDQQWANSSIPCASLQPWNRPSDNTRGPCRVAYSHSATHEQRESWQTWLHLQAVSYTRSWPILMADWSRWWYPSGSPASLNHASTRASIPSLRYESAANLEDHVFDYPTSACLFPYHFHHQ